MKLGKTITGEREAVQTELERIQNREKEKHRKILTTVIVIVAFALVVLSVGIIIYELVNKNKEQTTNNAGNEYPVTIEIIDESGVGYITDKMRQYVGKLERDLKDLGRQAVRVVVPEGKARELDVYLEGREEYYKCNLDRGTAETAEDIVKMVRYLESRDLRPGYVDVRVEEKAYYL